MRKFHQIFLALFGATAIGISLMHLALGPAVLLGLPPMSATMDSEDRFYAMMFLAYGVLVLSCVRDVEQKSRVVRFLALVLLLGGLARLVSMAAVGPPHPFFVAMTALELLVPVLLVVVQKRVAAAA